MKRASLHILFWIVYLFQDVLLIFLLNTTRLNKPPIENLLLSFENCLTLLLPKLVFTYFILFVTLNKIITHRFQKRAALYSLLALLMSLMLYRGLVVFFIDPIIYGWKSSFSFFYPLAFPVALMDVGFASGIAIAIKQVRQQILRTKVEQLLIREKLETELKYLRNQTNPHFLFNTLNNIYSLARKKSDQTAEVVLKLSKILRFMLYETEKPLITIQEEISMLEHYIDLEKIRYNSRLNLTLVKNISDEQAFISPLLLLPFVENAFKHGASENRLASFIHIEIGLQRGIFNFIVRNSKESNSGEYNKSTIGLNNVKRQLELLYSQYDLQVVNGVSEFSIALTINLKDYAKDKLSHC